MRCANNLSTFSTDTSCQLDVLGHDGDTLGVDGAQVGILKETDKVSFRCFLESHDSRALESQIGLEILSNFTDQTLEWQLPDEQFCALLVSSDFTESDGSGPVPMWLLDTTGSGGTLTCCFGCKLLPWSLSSSRFTGGLLCTCHSFFFNEQSRNEYLGLYSV